LTDKPLILQMYHYGGVALRGPVRWLSADDGDFRKQAARLHPTKPYFVFSPCVDAEFTIDQARRVFVDGPWRCGPQPGAIHFLYQ
jgi:hypothetical protein